MTVAAGPGYTRSASCAARWWWWTASTAWAGTSSSGSRCPAASSATGWCSTSTATWRSSRSRGHGRHASTGSGRFTGARCVSGGAGWLGRVCNGRGEPIDGGPRSSGAGADQRRSAQPRASEPPADPVLTGVSVIDALTTLVRGQKLPVFSCPGCRTCGWPPDRRPGHRRRRAVFRRVRRHRPDPRRRGVRPQRARERSAAGELVLLLNAADDPVIERLLTPRLALTVAEHLAFDCGGMCWWCSRHDQLRRGAARGVGRARRNPCPPRLSGLPLQRSGVAVRAVRQDQRPAGLGHRAARPDDARRRHHPPVPTSPATSPKARSSSPRSARRGRLPAGGRAVVAVAADAPRRGPGRTRDDHLACAQLLAALAKRTRCANWPN